MSFLPLGKKVEKKLGAKIAERKIRAGLESFGPKLLKAQKDGRNVVSAERALVGEKMVHSAMKKPVASGGAAENLDITQRGVVGNRKIRQEVVAARKGGEERAAKIELEQQARESFAFRKLKANREAKSAYIQPRQGGYDNPGLINHSNGKAAITGRPTPFNPGITMADSTTNDAMHPTGASRILAEKMGAL